ncbi:unnamed protein product [Prorocentrum cordatum]|uniref:Uncharacterized protein n=1 Tax=Prorocentrum cordatum TaxID=2364126 RepID=A0ABN9WAF8_9DINO|nr:unnamed protein product [Polarella glacialis]
MSDGGLDFGELCSKEGCTFELCPPANDRWHHYPFLRRLYDAALVLNTEYVIYLEPDNTVHGPITHPPTHDAGGIDVPGRNLGEIAYVEERASKIKPGFKLTKIAMNTGLAGGSYFRRAAILDAFNDDSVAQASMSLPLFSLSLSASSGLGARVALLRAELGSMTFGHRPPPLMRLVAVSSPVFRQALRASVRPGVMCH